MATYYKRFNTVKAARRAASTHHGGITDAAHMGYKSGTVAYTRKKVKGWAIVD